MNPLEDPLRKLNQRLSAMEADIAALGAVAIGAKTEEREDVGGAIRDARWSCRKCNALLAWYDPDTDVLRVRYKDHLLFSRVGGVGAEELVAAVFDGAMKAGVTLDERQTQVFAEAVAEAVVGGFVQIICRGCGEINTQAFMSNEEVAASQDAKRG